MAAFILSRIGGSLKEARVVLKGMLLDLKKTGITYRHLGMREEDIKYCGWLCNRNERIRRILSKIAVKWKRRHLITANEEDLITMDPPVKRLELYDWKQRRIYLFEAGTLFRCILKRLNAHDGMFANPLPPVNPYTNMPLTIGQLHFVVAQLRYHGLVHWSIEAFRAARYDWAEFTIVHDIALQMGAMQRVFMDLSSTDLHDTLIDFIEAEHIQHQVTMNKEIYLWFVQHAIETEFMTQWRTICYEYYKYQIVYKDIPMKLHMLHSSISRAAKVLCTIPREMYAMRHRKRSK